MDTAMMPAQVMISAAHRRFCIDGAAVALVNSAKDYWKKAAKKIEKRS